MYDKKAIGQRIKNIRLKHGQTQEEFGQVFSASKGNVATWEKGNSLPNKERLNMISKYGGITVNQLLYNLNDDNFELEEKIFNDLLKKYPEESHIGKALRFPDLEKRKELMQAGINRTLSVPILKNKLHTPESILENSIYLYITDDFLDFYINNYKSNTNILKFIENGLVHLQSTVYDYNFTSFHYELQNVFNDITLLFSNRDKSVDVNLLEYLEILLDKTINEIKELQTKYPDNKKTEEIITLAITNNKPKLKSEYSFDIDTGTTNDEKIKRISDELPTIIKKLIKNEPDLNNYLKDKGDTHDT
ncbi:helix-turn-helix domain-containing protein [Staphylococcus aureus]|uniref:helix-turn-helix domain-containing protein n=1 Tax=Staphylococcus aureus TaxID=1280 RepID=UPI000F4234BC|nr:helix-turn-helix transcriptional regulator [Staphylococcus aureus]RNH89963.1 XRE family transcriptional regulator [Staphylococcus aureus]